MKLVTVAEMREIERSANEAGITNEQMMQIAGEALADWVEKRFGTTGERVVLGLVGKGNNGGDTLVALISLLKSGWRATALLAAPRPDDPLLENFQHVGGQVVLFDADKFSAQTRGLFQTGVLILDGLLGTGIQLPLKPEASQYLSLVKKALKSGQVVVAVDCPSGMDCETGETAPETLAASATVCIEAVKIGLVKEQAFACCGELATVSLKLPRSLTAPYDAKKVADWQWAARCLPKRSAFSHKGTFGKVMIAGGSVNYVGAPLLAGLAAYRLGSGLVTLAVPHSVMAVVAPNAPEITWEILDEEGGVISETAAELLLSAAEKYDCLALGPGMGQEETTGRFLERLLLPPAKNNHRKMGFIESEVKQVPASKLPPVVLDADGLRWLAAQPKWFEEISPLTLVLTPHPGEMAALTGLTSAEIQSDRLACTVDFAHKWRQVVVLKGAVTVVAAPDGRVSVIPVANSALAKAGSGDILTGLIASLIGQKLPLFEAASLAAWIHAQAGICAVQQVGNPASVLARDLISALPAVLTLIQENA